MLKFWVLIIYMVTSDGSEMQIATAGAFTTEEDCMIAGSFLQDRIESQTLWRSDAICAETPLIDLEPDAQP